MTQKLIKIASNYRTPPPFCSPTVLREFYKILLQSAGFKKARDPWNIMRHTQISVSTV